MKRTIATALFLTVVVAPDVGLAHTGIGSTAAFAAGVTHPLGGLDHMLAMVAVGVWAGLKAFSSEVGTGSREENASDKKKSGKSALWLWPACFVAAMALGGVLGIEGIQIPFVEQGIIASIVLLGLAVALALSAPLAVGAVLIAGAGIMHGHAHGVEIPADANGLHYALGFVLATSLLHAVGVAATVIALRYGRPVVIRIAGALTVAAGLTLAFAGG